MREHDVDLVVMGTHGRSGLMNVLGSAASELLQWVPCVTLIVREPRAEDQGSLRAFIQRWRCSAL
ncbi:universal stress protein [Pseudomonas sp. D2-5]